MKCITPSLGPFLWYQVYLPQKPECPLCVRLSPSVSIFNETKRWSCLTVPLISLPLTSRFNNHLTRENLGGKLNKGKQNMLKGTWETFWVDANLFLSKGNYMGLFIFKFYQTNQENSNQLSFSIPDPCLTTVSSF